MLEPEMGGNLLALVHILESVGQVISFRVLVDMEMVFLVKETMVVVVLQI